LRSAGLEKRVLPGDSIRNYQNYLFTRIAFIPNNSRFEALKSSGELGVIEDRALQNKILDLYQYRIRALLSATDNFTFKQANQLVPFLVDNVKFQSHGASNLYEVIQLPKMQNFLILGEGVKQIIERYHGVMEQSRAIIGMIDRQYPGSK
jgi:hypothetical protein